MEDKRSTINFKKGNIYLFTVNRIEDNYCELLDEAGFICYLQDTNKYRLNKYQKLQCKVIEYKDSEKHPRIELVETENLVRRDIKVSEESVGSIMKSIGVSWNTKEFTRLLLMVESKNSFEDECHKWIRSLIDAKADLVNIRKDCFTFLEMSDFLSICNTTERDFYQQRITILIELMGYYIKANKLKEKDEGEKFINSLFEKLRKSGFVYHPNKNFNIMSCLFLNDRKLMEDKMIELYDILRQWGLEIWIKEPFRSTLIKVLELYINENIWKVDLERNGRDLVNSLIQALSLQYLLIGTNNEVEGVDLKVNASRLCTLSTYVNSLSFVHTLNLSLSNLLNPHPVLPSFSIRDTVGKMIPFFIGSVSKDRDTEIITTSSYFHGKAKLVVSSEGLQLYSGQDEQLKPMLPKTLGLWQNMQVFVNKKNLRTPVGLKDISIYEHFWKDVENEIFNAEVSSVTKTKSRKKHRIGETVDIIITGQEPDKPYILKARIMDEIGGEGYVTLDSMVGYQLSISMNDFLSSKGKNLVFEADIVDIDPEGRFKFTMIDAIKDWAEERYANYDDYIICSLSTDPPIGSKRIPAITKNGMGVSLGGFEMIEDDDFKKGDVVLARYRGKGSGSFHMVCDIVGPCENKDFNLQDAFRTLMREFALDDEISEPEVKEEDIQVNDRILDVSYMKEIIRIIDRMAVLDNEYVKSYNYLGFARILCMMIDWDSQAAYYKGRMELIAMLHDFAVNDRVDENKLDLLDNANAEMFSSNRYLKERYEQLRIVSFLNKPDSRDELLERCKNSEGVLYNLASLVISHNFMIEQNLISQANDIHNRIKQTLRLKGFESHLKIYDTGCEDLTTEYKTSIVYPPEEGMKANITKQMKNILKVIASFLNTQGGTLYIGVNDAGAGIGLENDLNYPEFNGDKDKYQRYISDTVTNTWGKLVSTCVNDIHFDTSNKEKDVLVVKVNPYPQGVEFEGKWWVRTVTSKRNLTKVEFDWYNSHNRQIDEVNADKVETSPAEVKIEPPMAVQPDHPKPKAVKTIPTSHIRKNPIEDYEEDYRPAIAYIKILDNGKFVKVPDYYKEDDEMLTLAVFEEEQNAYLILGYADGSFVKAPVDELLDKQDYVPGKRNTDSELIFATIARDEDCIISVTKESKATKRTMVRMDSISRLEEGKIASKGSRLYNEGLASEVLSLDVIPLSEQAELEPLINPDNRTLGLPGKTLINSMQKELKRLKVVYQ